MLRYALVILLVNINTYGLSFGLPVGQQSGSGTMIGNLLSELAKGCKSEFVVSIINSTLDECNLSIAPITESSIRCSMFYDASSVLCNLTKTTNTSKLAADFAAKTKTNQDLSEFCHEAAHLNLPLTRFHTNISKVLHKETVCTIVCAEKNIYIESNFYCKYYKWMLEIVHSHITPVIKKKKEPVGQVAISGLNKINNTSVTSALDGLPKKEDDKGTSSDANNKTLTNAVDTNQSHVEAQPESSSPDYGMVVVGHGNEAPKVINGDLDGDQEDQVIEDNEDPAYFDSEGMGDVDADYIPDNSDITPDKNEGGPQLFINSESSHGDTYGIPINAYTDDDDDNFSPFFLTAVIVAVVLYMVNKVDKMPRNGKDTRKGHSNEIGTLVINEVNKA